MQTQLLEASTKRRFEALLCIWTAKLGGLAMLQEYPALRDAEDAIHLCKGDQDAFSSYVLSPSTKNSITGVHVLIRWTLAAHIDDCIVATAYPGDKPHQFTQDQVPQPKDLLTQLRAAGWLNRIYNASLALGYTEEEFFVRVCDKVARHVAPKRVSLKKLLSFSMVHGVYFRGYTAMGLLLGGETGVNSHD